MDRKAEFMPLPNVPPPSFQERYLSYPAIRFEPEPGAIDEAVALLKSAQRPVIVVGAGAMKSSAWLEVQELAEKYLTDAAHLLPRDATVHEHLGDVFAKRGDYVRALTAYRAALKLEPEAKDEAKLKTKIAELEKQTQAAQRR